MDPHESTQDETRSEQNSDSRPDSDCSDAGAPRALQAIVAKVIDTLIGIYLIPDDSEHMLMQDHLW